tara:strand:- start:124929 stop:125522 length:594 start_codon:yes stop_codon:yes gene_type:complete
MKNILIATVLLAATAFNVQAISYTKGYSDTVGSSHSSTTVDNVTQRIIKERAVITDTTIGGGSDDNRCTGLNCGSADNITTSREVVSRNTNLRVTETGLNQTTGNTKNCTSFGNVNGLNFSEGTGTSVASTAGSSVLAATGDVNSVTRTTTHTTNGGAEVGKSHKVDKSFTSISELTKSSSASATNTSTFTSSTGYN